MRFLVLIESNTTGTGKLFVQTARRLALRPLLVTSDPGRYGYVDDALDVMRIDTGDYQVLESALCKFAAENHVAGIYSSSEYGIETSARLALQLGLPGAAPESIAICRNKRKQRECFNDRGLPVPHFKCITSDDELDSIINTFSLPVVVKPTQGSGSVGVKLCRNMEEIALHARALLQQKVNERGLPVAQEVLVEKYLPGQEYSVEIFGSEVVGITRKYLSREPYFVEIGHDFPVQTPHEVLHSLKQAAVQALKAVGLAWGPAHIEIKMTRDGPVVIEINPRLAGGFIPELVRQSTGIDLIECTILAAIGQESEFTRSLSKHASIRFLMPEREGILSAVHGLQDAKLIDAVAEVKLYKIPGDYVSCRGDFRDRLGHVIASHESAEAAMFYAEHAKDMLVPELAATNHELMDAATSRMGDAMIELRSDTFTLPTAAMLEAISHAELGNDDYQEDPTVRQLETLAAAQLGKEQACLMPSGTMANLALIKAHCNSTCNVVIVGSESDIYVYEREGSSVFPGLVYKPAPTQKDGTIEIRDLEKLFDETEAKGARVAVVCLENPHNLRGGVVLPPGYIQTVGKLVHRRKAKLHLDGARLFNAAVALKTTPANIALPVDSIQFCLSKGLSAPVGSMAVGSSALIENVRAIRKTLGGTMRQAGIIAAPGIVALEQMVGRLAEDHLNARRLAEGLALLPGIQMDLDNVQTNTVVFSITDPRFTCETFIAAVQARGVNLSEFRYGRIRAVLHYGIEEVQVRKTLQVLAEVLQSDKVEEAVCAQHAGDRQQENTFVKH
ncbi:MAG TPA: GntG family PLP-dependent aldolase [Candidatus Angelobacter sp.]|nr:GntG family PLP-dependent aldolase [Candidatus Angelobacter sp.]